MTHAVNLSYFDVLNPLIYPFGRSIGLFTTLKLEIQYGWILRNRMVCKNIIASSKLKLGRSSRSFHIIGTTNNISSYIHHFFIHNCHTHEYQHPSSVSEHCKPATEINSHFNVSGSIHLRKFRLPFPTGRANFFLAKNQPHHHRSTAENQWPLTR